MNNPNRELYDFLQLHCAPCEEKNVFFFGMKAVNEPDPKELKALIEAMRFERNGVRVDLFDGSEYGYIELGTWLGDQGFALTLMALGGQLKIWEILTPKSVLGDLVPEEMQKQMAGQGMVTIICRQPVATPAQS